MSLETQFEAHAREVVQRLTRIETKQDSFCEWIVKHEVDSKAGFARLTKLENSVENVKGGFWLLSFLGITGVIAWVKAKMGL